MKHIPVLSALLLPWLGQTALAHVGPESLQQHLLEHILLYLPLAVVVGYAFLRLIGSVKRDQR